MATAKTPNFTPDQEASIRAASEAGPLNLDVATRLGAEMGKSYRSIVAKITRMGLPYQSKQPTTKTGSPVTSKSKLRDAIAAIVGGNLDGLEKAPKPVLQRLANFVEDAAATLDDGEDEAEAA
jgi:hypothetical protein